MAKKKKSSKESSLKTRHSKNNTATWIRLTLATAAYVFVLASIFDQAGSYGHVVHGWFAALLGDATPAFALFLIWVVLRHYFPKRFTVRLVTVIGLLLFLIAFTAVRHSFVGVEAHAAAVKGYGGGLLGFYVSDFFINSFGLVFGRLLLFALLFISIMLILDKAIMPFLHIQDIEEDEDMDQVSDSKVRVAGEIVDTQSEGAFGRLKKRLVGKTPVVEQVQPMPIKKNRVDGVQQLPRAVNWNYPPTSLLEIFDMKPQAGNLHKRMEVIQKTLRDFGIEVTMGDVNIGPTVTQFTLKPAEGVKLNQITARQDDLALALAAQSLRVEAPIPGKGLVGIEIPNEKKAKVGLRDILEDNVFKRMNSHLAIALGRDVAGEPAAADLDKMPHILIAGATGSGKSVAINSLIITLLMNNSPDELRLILVDPKRVELTGYNGIPHLLTPVITEAKDTVAALGWTVREMDRRYKLFQSTGKRNIEQYNFEPELAEGRLPYIVLIIDELADLMMVAAREVEGSIVRLAQMARAVGIHLVVATQRPSVDVITGLIKANIPTRMAFAVASQIDSRTIIDMSGAEKLLGYGDMLYVSTDIGKPKRIQGALVLEREITSIIAHIKMQEDGDRYDPSVLETRVESRLGGNREGGEIDDDLYHEAYEVVRLAGKASSTLLQTRLSVGYARAARLMQAMEDKGLIGPAKGSKPREVYGASMSDNANDNEQGIAPYPENQ